MRSEEQMQAEPRAGAFIKCLVDGDDVRENAREKKSKRLAMGLSILLESAGLAALVIAPLFAEPAELTERIAVPIPPYSRHAAQQHSSAAQPARPRLQRPGFFESGKVPVAIHSYDDPKPPGDAIDHTTGFPGEKTSTGLLAGIEIRREPPPPPVRESKRLVLGHIDPALLTRRVEPVFPALARQLRKNGRVELHALIAIDGSVQSLELVSGDPLFVNSALEAVRQWHYKPMYLNGQPVEIDTYITVIYTFEQ